MVDAIDSKAVAETEAETPGVVRIAMRDIVANIVGAMGDRRRMSKDFPAFPHKVHAHQPDKNSGMRHILIDDGEGVVHQVDETQLACLVMQWLRDERMALGTDKYQLSATQVLKLIEDWKTLQRKLIDPADVLWKEEPGFTFRRLPWSKDEVAGKPTPLWDEYLTRLDGHAPVVMAFIGSLFHPQADLQQYLYLQGEGGDGKGTLIRFLEWVMGLAFKAEDIPGAQDKFWTHGLLNKRLIAFSDADPKEMLKSGKIKSLLGGDSQRIEPKGKASYTARLRCKILISANPMPNITSSPADIRRCLLIPFPKRPNAVRIDPSYEQKLQAEGGAFLVKCLDVYSALCPKHGPIPYDKTDLLHHVASLEDAYEGFFDNNFDYYPEELALAPSLRHHRAAPHAVYDRVQLEFKRNKKDIEAFFNWLRINRAVRCDKFRLDGKFARFYTAIELKPPMLNI